MAGEARLRRRGLSPIVALAGWLAAVAFCPSASVAAKVYRCEDADGGVTYRQTPCYEGQAQGEIAVADEPAAPVEPEPDADGTAISEPEPDAQDTVISERELQGTWSDSASPSPFRSRWTFASPMMTMHRYDGRVIRASYTLEGDTLTIHHEPSLLDDQPWDEELELIAYDGRTLTWRAATTVRLHRLD